MSKAKVTIFAMNRHKPLFTNIIFPEGIDKDIAIDSIIIECGEFEPLYSDWDFLKYAIDTWAKKYYNSFVHLIKDMEVEYNPLYNFNRYEEWTDTGKSKSVTKSDSEDKKSSFNSDSYQPVLKNNGNIGNDTNADSEHKGHMYGNIGVTTMQYLLGKDVQFWNGKSIYNYVVESFKKNLCLGVYR